MARRKAPAKPRKPTKPKKAKAPKPVDEGPAKPGMPFESAVLVGTAILLFAALILVFIEKGQHYGEGPFKGMFGG